VRAFVCFEAGAGQRYALDVADSGGVFPLEPLEALPVPLPEVLGLLRTGGDLLPVLGALGATGRHVVVVRSGTERFGLLVDEVTAVVRVRDEQLSPPPNGQAEDVVRAVAGGAGRGALVLDAGVLSTRLRR
jgi:chemotaxis signal transduction protein